MATDVERLVVRLEASQRKFERQLERANRTANKRASAIERRFGAMNSRLSAGAARLGGRLAGAFAAAVTIRGAQRLIDAATRIENALKVAGLAGEELARVQDRLFASARANAAPVESLVELYSRAALVQGELGVSTEELLGFTDAIAVALRVSGKSAAESSGALLQLSQALGSGIVRAEEFNSILEGALPIAQAAAAGLEEAGGSVAKLRRLVIEGKVSSEAFFRAFEAGAGTLQDKVGDAQLTVAQGFTNIETALIAAADEFDDGADAAGRFARALEDVADWIDRMDLEGFGSSLGTVVDRLDAALNATTKWGRALGEVLGTDAIGAFLTDNAVARAFGLAPTATVERMRRPPEFGRAPFPGLQPPQRRPVSLADFEPPGGDGDGGGGTADAFAREVAQLEKRTRSIETMTRAQAALNPMVEDYGLALEKARAAAELEAAAREAGMAVTPQLSAEIDRLAGAYAAASAGAEALAAEQGLVRQSAADMRALAKDALSGMISDLREGKSAAEAFAGALDRIADRLLDQALSTLFAGPGTGTGVGGAGLLGGLLIPGILHRGGVAGRDGYGHARAVPAAAFGNASRYHGGGTAGIRPGEVPAILQRGEVVIPRGARGPGGGGVSVVQNFDFSGADPATVAQLRAQLPQVREEAKAGAVAAVRQMIRTDPSFRRP